MKFLNRIYLFWSDTARAFQFFQVVRQSTAILIGIILAKSSLTLDEIGKYELWMYIASIWAYFWFQGTNQAFIAWYPKLPKDQKPKAFISLFLLHHAFSFLFVLVFLLNHGSFGKWLAQTNEFPLYYNLLLLLPPYLISSVTPIFLMLRNLNKAQLVYSVFYLGSQLLAVLVPILLGAGLPGIMTGLLIAAIIHYFVLIAILLKTAVFGLVSKVHFIQLLSSVWPLLAYTVIGAFAPLFDAWLVNFTYSNSETFAIFRYGAKELPLSLALASAFHMGMIAELARDNTTGLKRIREGAIRLMKWFFPIAILLIIVSKPLYSLVFSPSFIQSAEIFNIYLLVVISRWFFPHSILMANGKNYILIIVAAIEMAINVGLSILLVSVIGLSGIALATVIAYWFEKFCLITWIQKNLRIKVSEYMDLRLWSSFTILTLIVFTIVHLIMFS